MKLYQHKAFLIAYIGIVSVVIFTSSSWQIHKEYPYQFDYGSDINQYYGYLPQIIIHNDPAYKTNLDRKYWLIPNQKGIPLPKMTMGMTILYLPGFLIGHGVAKITNYPADGYSKPYSVSLRITTYFYVSIALYLLYLSLLRYFKPRISASSVFLIFVSTNLYYYTLCEGEMTHSYLFFLFTLIINFTFRWFDKASPKYLFFVSIALGLAILIRPTSIIVSLFPLLYGLSKVNFLSHLKNNLLAYLLAIPLLLLPFFVQMIYWKIYGGTWIRWSYGDEKFYFGSPHIVDFLFSYRKGWFVYTPIMLFAIIGMFWLPKRISEMKWSIPLITGLAVFILSSWWCWWFGGSFGSRAMIEFYAFLIFPLAVFIDRISSIKYLNIALVMLVIFTSFFNILGTHKKTWWQLHWDSMSKEAFWITFSEIDVSQDRKQALEDAYKTPDYENARKGLPERERPFK